MHYDQGSELESYSIILPVLYHSHLKHDKRYGFHLQSQRHPISKLVHIKQAMNFNREVMFKFNIGQTQGQLDKVVG